jgi:hypothetical protein
VASAFDGADHLLLAQHDLAIDGVPGTFEPDLVTPARNHQTCR